MNTKRMLFIACAVLPLAGCASNRGGAESTGETSDTLSGPATIMSADTVTNAEGTANTYGESNPSPVGSPTFRPGMNSRDIRDPQFIQRQQQLQAPPPGPP